MRKMAKPKRVPRLGQVLLALLVVQAAAPVSKMLHFPKMEMKTGGLALDMEEDVLRMIGFLTRRNGTRITSASSSPSTSQSISTVQVGLRSYLR